jgi:hypothetical protein
MARCYDVIKSRHPSVRVLTSLSSRGNDNPRARSNISHSVRNFVRGWAALIAVRTAGLGSLTPGGRTSTARVRRSARGCVTASISAKATTRDCSPT